MGLEYKAKGDSSLIIAVVILVVVLIIARYYFSRESLELTPLEPRPFRCPYADNEECPYRFRRGFNRSCPFRNM